MTYNKKKNPSINRNISKIGPLTPKEVDVMLLNDDIYEQDNKVLIKCDRCGYEMELNAYILREMAEADDDDKLPCICMECGKETMY